MLDADGINLGPDPDGMLADVLDQDAELVMPLADERWAWIPALLGRTPNRSSSAIGPRTERTCRTTAASASPEVPDIAQTLPARTEPILPTRVSGQRDGLVCQTRRRDNDGVIRVWVISMRPTLQNPSS